MGGCYGWGVRVDVNENEVFVKIQKKKFFFFWGGGSGGGGVGPGGWVGLGSGLGVRVNVNEELKFLGKFTKEKFGWGVERGGVRWGSRVGGGVRVDVNAMFGVVGVVGHGNQE